MTTRIRLTFPLTLAVVAMVAVVPSSTPAAPLETQLGILDLSANGGINPATGAPWAHNDTYRLVFTTSTGTAADAGTATDIGYYNDFVKNLADLSPLGLSSVDWRVVGSTEDVDARDNTNTNSLLDGTGESVWLMNGTEFIADNYADFYGSRLNGENIDLSETGGAPFDGGDFTSVWTGTLSDGTKASPFFLGSTTDDAGIFGDPDILPDTRTGLWGTGSAAQWINRFTITNTDLKALYGLSEPLTVIDPDQLTGPVVVPEPTSIAAWGILALVLAGFGYYRSRRKK